MKRLYLAVVLLLLQLAVVACGDGGTPPPTTPPTPPIPVPPPPPANRAPTVGTAIGDRSVEEGAQVTVSVSGAFSDPDGDALNYAAVSDAPTVATASVSGTDVIVTAVAPGTANVTVTATDPGGLSATQSFGVTVTSANQAPTVETAIEDQAVQAGEELTLDLSGAFSDPDEDALTYEADSDAPTVATASVSGNEVTVTGVAPGTANVTVTATDPEGLSATQTFGVTVEAAPTGPTLDALFAPATAAEIAQVEAEWAMRTPEVSGVRLELDTVQTALLGPSPRVRILSHTVGGVRHYGAVVTPAGAEPGSLPVIVVAHGDNNGADVDETAQLLTLLGFRNLTAGLVIPSYRAEALRYAGREYLSEGSPSPWDRDVDDVLSFLSVAFEQAPELDAGRVAALGFSRGGAVSLLAARRDRRIEVVIELAGPTDFLGEYAREIVEDALGGDVSSLPGFDDLNDLVIQPWQEGNLSTEEARIEMVRRSPVYFVDRMPPVQLHHGDADPVVAVSEAQGLIDAMREAGKTDEEFEAHIHAGFSDDQQALLLGAAAEAIDFARPFIFDP